MTVRIVFDNQVLGCDAGITLAAALTQRLRCHERGTRRSINGEWRAPFCGMGTCFECRVTVDGAAHQRSCQLVVRDGMQVQMEVQHEG